MNAQLHGMEATVRRRETSVRPASSFSTSTEVRTPWYSYVRNEFPGAFLARTDTSFHSTSNLVTDLVVETASGFLQFCFPVSIPVWEGDRVVLIGDESNVIAVSNVVTGKVFRTGYDPLRNCPWEAMDGGATFLSSVGSTFLYGTIAIGAAFIAWHTWKGSGGASWIAVLVALGAGALAVSAVPIWFLSWFIPAIKRSNLDDKMKEAIEKAKAREAIRTTTVSGISNH